MLAAAPALGAEPGGPTAVEPPTDPVDLQADSLAYEADTDRYIARGQVLLRFGEVALRADEVVLDQARGVAEARGHVVLVRRAAVFNGDSARLELDDLTGLLRRARILLRRGDPPTPWPPPTAESLDRMAAEVEVCGDEIEKISDERFLVRRGAFTPCRCPGGETASWRLESIKADAEIGESALLTLPVFHIKDTPLFYLPVLDLPLSERRSGLLWPRLASLPQVGWNIGESVYWAPREDLDLTLDADLFTERGVRGGLEFRYAVAEDFRGRWYGSYLYDWAIDDEQEDRPHWTQVHRFTVDAAHRQRFLRRGRLALRVELLSDKGTATYFRDSLARREAEFTESNLLLYGDLEDHFFGVETTYFQNLKAAGPLFGAYDDAYTIRTEGGRFATRAPSDATVHRLPRLVAQVLPRRIGFLPLSFEADAEFVNRTRFAPAVVAAQMQDEEGNPVEIKEGSSQDKLWRPGEVRSDRRVRIGGRVSLPLALGNGALELTPSISLVQIMTQRDRGTLGWEDRGFLELGGRLSSSLHRVFEVNDKLRLKHEIEPFVHYRFRPVDWEEGDDEIDGLLLDPFDRLWDVHRFSFGLANRLIERRVKNKGRAPRYRRIVDLELSQAVDLDPWEDEGHIGPTRIELESYVHPLKLDWDFGFDPGEPGLQEVLGRVRIAGPYGLAASLRYVYLRKGVGYRFEYGRNPGKIHEVQFAPSATILRNARLSFLLRYRITDNTTLVTGAGLTYRSPCRCWSLKFNIMQYPSEGSPRLQVLLDLSRLGSFGG